MPENYTRLGRLEDKLSNLALSFEKHEKQDEQRFGDVGRELGAIKSTLNRWSGAIALIAGAPAWIMLVMRFIGK
jgi:hypothetical protein